MNRPLGAGPAWSTAAFGGAADMLPIEMSALGEHLAGCRSVSGRMFALRCAAETVHGFVVARFVTTVLVVGLVIGAALLAF